ncbi:MAG: ankyrin repeat domain-containing protein [Bacteroidota bacterium]
MKRIHAFLASIALLSPLHAAHLLDVGDEKEGYQTPYAHLQNPNPQVGKEMFNFDASHRITDLTSLQDDLEDDVDSVVKKLEDKNSFLFLGAGLRKTQSNAHYRCLIVNPAFKGERRAIRRAKQKKFYLIKSENQHFLLQLLGLLHVQKEYTIQTMYSSPYVCRNCHFFALYLFEIHLPLNEKGCFGIPFPSSEKMPASAMAYINSHLTLPLVEELVVPMMGYVKGDELQIKDQEIANLRREVQRKDDQLDKKEKKLCSQEREITNLRIALTQKINEIVSLKKEVLFLKRKPLDEATEEEWWWAIKQNNEDAVKQILVDYIVDVNAKDEYGYTPLHWVASKNNKGIAEILLQHGADVNAKDKDGWTPLCFARELNRKEVIDFFNGWVEASGNI